MKIIIVGAGIGGLTAAIGLASDGHDVQILEKASQISEIGAGIQLGANAVNVLQSYGLKNSLDKVCVSPEEIRFACYKSNQVYSKTILGENYANKYGAPYYHIHRADLHRILKDKFESLSPDSIHLLKDVRGYTENSDGVRAYTDTEGFHAELLVAADGIKSNIRSQIANQTTQNWTGYVAWRGLVDAERLPSNFMDKVVTNFIGPDKHMVLYYLRDQQLLNFVGVVEDKEWKHDSWVQKADWRVLKNDFCGWNDTVQSVIDNTNKEACYRWALHNNRPLRNWSTKKATLLGDAAHATLPFMASGAAMAIEDAEILRRCLKVESNVENALSLYQKHRIPRTKKVQTNSSKLGKIYHIKNNHVRKLVMKVASNTGTARNFLPSYNPVIAPLE